MLISQVAFSQATFSFGPRVGGRVSTVRFQQRNKGNLKSPYSPKASYRFGWSAGLAGEIGFEHWAIQPAVLYEQGGFKSQTLYNNGITTFDNQDDVRLHYLTIPLQVAYRQQVAGQGMQVFAGPYLGLLLGGHYRSTSSDINGSLYSEASAPVSANPNASPSPGLVLQRFDAGLEGGIGYCYQNFLMKAGYRLGLYNVNSDKYYGLISFGDTRYQNRAFEISITYSFSTKDYKSRFRYL